MLGNPMLYFAALPVLAWVMYGFCMENKNALYNRKTLGVALVCNGALALATICCYRVGLHKPLSHPTLLVYACIVWAAIALRTVIAFRQIGRVRRPSEWSYVGAVLVGLLSAAVVAGAFLD